MAGAARALQSAGPYRVVELPVMNIPLGQSVNGPLSVQLEVLHPQGQRQSPLVILSPGESPGE